jgi:putative addiction module component (TIGR02574 family)
MSLLPADFDYSQMSVSERIALIGDLWDSLDDDELPELTEAQTDELRRRVEDSRRDPNCGSTWEEVRNRIQSRQ